MTMVELTRVPRSDALPEYSDYRDTGCEVSPSCLSCPFVRCRYDTRDGVRGLRSIQRNIDIAKDYRSGVRINDIMSRCGVSRRTVFRVVA